MPARSAPAFWYQSSPALVARLLLPLAYLYGGLAAMHGTLRQRRVETRFPPVPVISVGNLVAGGAGKTPVVQALATHFAALGHQVAIVSRGYGGFASVTAFPTRVDPSQHTAREVGDEPLMLASHFRHQPVQVWVCRQRPAAVRRAIGSGATLVILDDGFQRLDVPRTHNLLIVDGQQGFGNRLPLPAGPLREFYTARQRATHTVIINAPQNALAVATDLPNPYHLTSTLDSQPLLPLQKKKVIAFAGLAQPDKFFNALRAAGFSPLLTFSYPDHHSYTATNLRHLHSQAQGRGAALVTTSKDAAKLPPGFATALPLTLGGPDLSRLLHDLTAPASTTPRLA